MPKQTCRTCKNFKNGICSVLNDVLLINTRILNSKGETLIEVYPNNSLIIKDEYLDNFKCNKFKGE